MNRGLQIKPTYDIDDDPNKHKIVRDLVKQVAYSKIKDKYPESKLTINKLKRYAEKKISYDISKSLVSERALTTQTLIDMMKNLMVVTNQMLVDCQEELQDIDRPGHLDLKPHAFEYDVSYWEEGHRRKKNLQRLIDEVKTGSDLNIISVQTKVADPRVLLLKSIEIFQKNMEFLARITGQMQDVAVTVDVSGVVIPTLVQIIVRDTADYPQLQEKLIDDIEEVLTNVKSL